MTRRTFLTALFVVCLACGIEAKPAVKVRFELISKTLDSTLANKSLVTNHDWRKDVTDQLVGELQQRATYYFPFIDWRTDDQNARKSLIVIIWEYPLRPGRSDYKIQYWTGGRRIAGGWQGGREVPVGNPEAFIPWSDPQPPTDDPPELIQRAKASIATDMQRASTKDMLNFFLKDVEIITIPPPAQGLRLVQPCLFDLPLSWDALLADRESSVLKATFSSKVLPDGWMELEQLHRCENDCRQANCVRGELRQSNLPGIPTCPGATWTGDQMKAVSQLFSIEALQSLKITVKQYSRFVADSDQ